MVSASHEAMHQLFREDPGVFNRTFRRLGQDFPEAVSVELLPTDLTELQPLERRLDTLLRFHTVDGERYLLLVEAQRDYQADKVSAWAYYAGYLYARYGDPPVLLVVCHDVATAAWASSAHRIGLPVWPTLTLRACVLGPHNTPVILDPEEAAADIMLAMFAALTHVQDKQIPQILRTLSVALRTMDRETADFVAEYTEVGLGKFPAARLWRDLMAIPLSFFRSETSQRLREEGHKQGMEEGRQEGMVTGRVQAGVRHLLKLLDARDVPISAAERERVESCLDPDVLDAWIDRALSITSVAELFD